VSQPFYELSDLQDRIIEGQFYIYECAKLPVTTQTEFGIGKITLTRIKTVLNNILSSGEDTTRHSSHG